MTADTNDNMLRLNPLLRIVPIAGQRGGHDSLLELDDRNGRTQRMTVGADAMRLLEGLRDGTSWFDYQRALEAEGRNAQEVDTIGKFLLGPCRDKRILVAPESVQEAADQPSRPPYLNLMIQLLPPAVVNALSSRLHALFARTALIVGIVAIVAAMAAMFVAMHAMPVAPALNAAEVLAVGGIAAFGILLHELGHAAAAYRLGARRVSIGVGLYLVIPVAYSELSELWRYPRRSRVVVDCAGVYMQGLVLVGLMVLHFSMAEPLWLVAAGATATSMLWNLNPFLRMDGYWIVADALGIHDLRSRAVNALRVACGRALGRPAPDRAGSPALLIYATLSTVFLSWMLYRAVVFLFDAALVSWPQAVERLQSMSFNDLSVSEALLGTVLVSWQLLFAYVAIRFVAAAPQRVWRWWRQDRLATS